METLISKDEEDNSDNDSRSSPTEFIKSEMIDDDDEDSDMSDGIVVGDDSKNDSSKLDDDNDQSTLLETSLDDIKMKDEDDEDESKDYLDVLNVASVPPLIGTHKDSKKKEKTKRELEEEEREKMQVLVSNFTEDQLNHYEMFRRSAFPRAAIKRLMQTLTGTTISQNVVIAMAGIAKVFVGEIVEEALDVMEKKGESGPIQPKHIREAVRRLRRLSSIPNTRPMPPINI